MSRKELLTGAAAGAVGVGVLGGLAACQNTTTPIGAGEGGAGSQLVEAKPLGPGGLPLPRPDNAVTWAITDDNQPIAEGKKPEGGPLHVYNYADYIDPAWSRSSRSSTARKVKIATYNSSDEAIAKLASGRCRFDVIIGLSRRGHRQPDRPAAARSRSTTRYLPNLPKNIWPELQDPFYDRGSRYTVPYVVWSDGIGWRNDKVARGHRRRWTSRGTSSGSRRRTAARSACSTTSATALSMPMQRDAMRTGVRPDLNTEDAADRRQGGARPRAADRHLQHQGRRSPTTRRCPRRRRCCTTRGRATC